MHIYQHMQELLSRQDIKTVRPLSVRMTFEDNHNWDAFSLANKDILRDIEINEVKMMMSCKDENRGFFNYHCNHCGTDLTIDFGCNSRICTNCGKNHTDKWSKSLEKALFNVPHRHAVFIIPDILWTIVRANRFLHKVLMDAAIKAINRSRMKFVYSGNFSVLIGTPIMIELPPPFANAQVVFAIERGDGIASLNSRFLLSSEDRRS